MALYSYGPIYLWPAAAPAGDSDSVAVTVTLGSQASTKIGLISYDAPAVSASMPSNHPTTGGGIVSLSGVNFGSSDPSPTVMRATWPT